MASTKPIFFRQPGMDQWQMCRRKARYETKEQAIRRNSKQRAYCCPYCGNWHLTTRKKGEMK